MMSFLICACAVGEVEAQRNLKDINKRWEELREMELPIPGIKCIHCGGDVYLAAATMFGMRYCLNCTHLQEYEVV